MDRRIRHALGPDPLNDARYLLPPLAEGGLSFNAADEEDPDSPRPATQFVVDLVGQTAAVSRDAVAAVFPPATRATMDFPLIVGRLVRTRLWVSLASANENARFAEVALCWDLASLLAGDVAETARDLARFVIEAGRAAPLLGRAAAVPREPPSAAARRAAPLRALKERFARSVELRLLPVGAPFPARRVWRAAYALGLEWGKGDLLHWHEARTQQRLFTLSALGAHGTFVPERAAEGEAVSGLALGFELPFSPDPVGVFDRVAVALAFLRETLGGRPALASNDELDGDRLDVLRGEITEMISEMVRAGIAPGSPAAARFF